jgi:hypothetical protein
MGGGDNPEARERGIATTKNLLEWKDDVKLGVLGFSVFGGGLNKCDSI